MEDTKIIEEFPDYAIARDGTVYTISHGRPRRPSKTQQGAVKITLYRDGVPYTKSLALLVAKAWLYNDHDPEIFDTPIHLDNDPANNHVDNLAWRPRWFAVKYQQQYWNEEFRYSRTRIENIHTGEVFESIMDVCQAHGLLFVDVFKSCTKGTPVFPSWKIFGFL